MDENNRVIETMLKEQGHEATQSAKQAITDFSILYAKKLISRCLKGGNKMTFSLQDLRFAYEAMNKMHTTQYDLQLQERRMRAINYMNKDLNAQKFQKAPSEVNTVSLYPNSENPHMRTGWEYQIAYENN